VSEQTDVIDLGEAVDTMAASLGRGIRQRRALRVTLLSLAATILLLGAAVALTFCYLMLTSG